MTRPNYDAIRRMLAEFLETGDPEDPRERKRRRILSAATDLFLRHGYRKTNVDDVARSAGVSKGTLYLHFKSKAELLVQAIALEKTRYLVRMKPFLEPAMEPRQRLTEYLATVFELVIDMPLVSRMTRGDHEILVALEEWDPQMRSRTEAMQLDFVADFLRPFADEHGWPDSHFRERVQVMLSLLFQASALMDEAMRGGIEAPRFAALLAKTLVEGLTRSWEDPA
jgi:AcrR family transcriptional regulator